ncbi:MAG: DUF2914 domain-containing protein [Chitinispirillia bacterium]|nr:DUF2914 domain-containing protein [Chitinispirillia bacterium]
MRVSVTIAAVCLLLGSSVIFAEGEAKKETAAPAEKKCDAKKEAAVPAEKKNEVKEVKKEAAPAGAPAPKAEKKAAPAATEKKGEVKKDAVAPASKAEKKVAAPRGASGMTVKKGVVCSSIKDRREPVGASDKFSKDVKELFFFTHVTGAVDTMKIEHRWFHNGNRVQTTVLPVRSPYFRTFSRRTFANPADNIGKWKVEAVDQAKGTVLKSVEFTIE